MLSYPENIHTILTAVFNSGAKKILDVGGGMGKFAILIREEDLSLQAQAGNMTPHPSIQIDCCEDTKFFTEQPYHDFIYDNHYHVDVFSLDFPMDYDLYLFIDTVEHWDKEKAKEMLSKLPGKKLISTPKNTTMYEEHFYGDSRHHISQWNEKDFNGQDFSTDLSHIYII